MAEESRWDVGFGPDPKAVAFLEAKGLKRSWRWPSMWQTEHAFAFTLAGVHRLDVLQAAQTLVTKAVAEGTTLEAFRSDFEDQLKALGFSGPQVSTGFPEGDREVNLSASWRQKVIYDTNVRQAYAAAEWAAIEDTASDFPALRYHHLPQEHPRLQHLAWDGIVLPVGHAFWRTHYPQNGWYCKCWTSQVSVDELAGGVKLSSDAELAATGYSADPATWPEWRDNRTGRTERVPPGISPGFAYNAGQTRRANLGDFLQRKVDGLDPDLARAAAADLVNFPAFRDLVDDAVALGQARASAAKAAAARLVGGSATKREIDQAASAAAGEAGAFPTDSWPVGVAPPQVATQAPGAPRVVVANASAIGHSADLHPTTPADWRRVQQLLELGEIRQGKDGTLTLFGQFVGPDGKPVTWLMALKPVAGAWRVRTLHQASPRRRARISRDTELVRPAAGALADQG